MRRFLDGILNRFSMYTVVSISLIILFAVSIVLSLIGELAYTPWALIASAIVLVGATYAASALGAWLFRAPLHAESSFITGMILLFIMPPSVTVAGLVGLAVVGVLAGLSKFLLAWKGRHIFNPVAAGAFAAGVFGVTYATWWVATPPLFVFVLTPTLLILYKTRRLAMGAVFAIVAGALLYGLFVSYGLSPAESIALFLSWPLLFFLGFMLTEPQTMPAKQWQQFVYAAGVGALFAIPISIGAFETDPLSALLIGNLFAFVVSRRAGIRLEFQSRKALTPTTDELIFTARKPVRYEAGQYFELTVPHPKKDFRGIRRMFSVTSASNDQTVRFGVKYYTPSSSFKRALRTLKKGQVIYAPAVNGDFVLPKDASKPLLYIAGGIGITPFIAHLRTLIERKEETRDIVLVYAVQSTDELAYLDVLQQAGVRCILVINDEKKVTVPKGWAVVRAPFVTEPILKAHVHGIDSHAAYISGPPGLVRALKPALTRLHAREIHTDYFTGY